MSGMRSYNPEQIMLSAAVRTSSRDINVMKEKLIFSGKSLTVVLFSRSFEFLELNPPVAKHYEPLSVCMCV